MANNKKVKVLIVDDSAFMRKVLSDMLESDELTIVGTAINGKDALEKISMLNPDVVTLDVEMPVMDGLVCLKEIMLKFPRPVIMLSSTTKEGAQLTIRALDEGAVDFIAKPQNVFDIKGDKKKNEIIEKILVASNIRFNTVQAQVKKNEVVRTQKVLRPLNYIIAIGTSTGGPKALQSVIPFLPGDLPAAVLVVQHMPAGFTKTLAERLDSKSSLTVKEAEHKEKVSAGCVYIAPGDSHMKVGKDERGELVIILDKSSPVGGHRPSVDVMMNSLSETGFRNIVGVIMTGMGSDGSAGVNKLKQRNNSYVIAQDEETSVVYGMPRMAVQTGAVDKIVPLDKISEEIIQFLGVR